MVLSVSGGDRISKTITVDNNSKDEMDIRVYWEDFQYQAPYDGSKKFLPAGTGMGSASGWIQYMPQEFKIPPSGKQKIDYTINVPAQVEGGHYGVLFFEKSTGAATDVTGVRIVTRIGCLFFIEAKNKAKKAQVGDIAVAGGDLTGTLTNAGDVVLIPRITYYVMDESGMVADRGELGRLYIPPGESAPWKLPLPKELAAGRYSLMVNADLEEGDIAVKDITLQKSSSGEFTVEKVQD
ncbi:MAG: hypothetical protein WCO69_03610 [Candidatus Omnitrophota bacterium]